MHLTFRNVNDAFRGIVGGIHRGLGEWRWEYGPPPQTIPVTKRPYSNPNGSGHCYTVEEPVVVTYTKPSERVLINTIRDANCFFALYESLWMLAGRNDVASLAYYNSKIKDYSDDGKTFNGAYGYRWRQAKVTSQTHALAPGYGLIRGEYVGRDEVVSAADQLDLLVDHLANNPSSRRAVLTMWNVEDDLLKIGTTKDPCCNLNVMFSLRPANCSGCSGSGVVVINDKGDHTSYRACERCHKIGKDPMGVLDMTVTNRSNDLVWGMIGANYVQFTMLQEYMASRLGVQMGLYHHVTNNLHAYDWNWKPEEWLMAEATFDRRLDPYPPERDDFVYTPLVLDRDVFEQELGHFVTGHGKDAFARVYREPFFANVAQPTCIAWHYYKRREHTQAISVARSIRSDDWRVAALGWLERHIKARDEAASYRGGHP